MASSVKAKGFKKEELSFSSCNNCKGFSIFRVGTMKRMCCVCLNKGKDHPSTVETTDKFEPHTNLCVSILMKYIGGQSVVTSGTFLVEEGPYYYCMLEILFGRLSLPLYNQALKKISKFVKTNILPGAIAEVGLLCCACVHSNPEEAVTQLVEPILLSVISSLEGTPATGFGGRGMCDASVSTKVKPTISPALETAIDHQLKVNGAGDHLLRSLLGSLILYYPIDQYKCILHHPNAAALEEWISTKDYSGDKPMVAPKWHIPSVEEVEFANELLDLHFQLALDDLSRICETKVHSDPGR
ncbi:unnamed protein product [Prunus armeniaca]